MEKEQRRGADLDPWHNVRTAPCLPRAFVEMITGQEATAKRQDKWSGHDLAFCLAPGPPHNFFFFYNRRSCAEKSMHLLPIKSNHRTFAVHTPPIIQSSTLPPSSPSSS